MQNTHSDEEPFPPKSVESFSKNSMLDLQDLESFKKTFIDNNRGRPIYLVRFENVAGKSLIDFINLLKKEIRSIIECKEL